MNYVLFRFHLIVICVSGAVLLNLILGLSDNKCTESLHYKYVDIYQAGEGLIKRCCYWLHYGKCRISSLMSPQLYENAKQYLWKPGKLIQSFQL